MQLKPNYSVYIDIYVAETSYLYKWIWLLVGLYLKRLIMICVTSMLNPCDIQITVYL